MKRFATPFIASALVMASVNVYAQGYSDENIKDIIHSMDDNADKSVGFQEYFEDTITDNKDSLDTNNDGYITSGEVVIEITEDLIETIKEMRKLGVSEQDMNKTIASELNTAEKEAEALIKKMDTDGDNLVEPSELEAYEQKQFNSLDKNHDGVISQSDVKKSKGFPIRLR